MKNSRGNGVFVDGYLNADNQQKGNEIVAAFFEQVLPRYQRSDVTRLGFVFLGLTDVTAALLMNSLPRIPNLKRLELSYNKMGPAAALASSRSPSLLQLNLSGNIIGAVGIRAFVQHRPTFLVSLELKECGIGDEGMRHVATLLRSLRYLKTIDLRANGITDTKLISSALAFNSELWELRLDDNDITNGGISGVARALCHNKRLTDLHLCNNALTDLSCLETVLSHNLTVRFLAIRGNATGEAAADAITAFASDVGYRRIRMQQRLSLLLLESPTCSQQGNGPNVSKRQRML